MKIYIIGGHGFVGRHLLWRLLTRIRDVDVEVIDPKIPENSPGLSYTHTASRVNNLPATHFQRGLYIHLASNSQHNPTILESKRDLDTFLHVIGMAALNGSALLVASTSAVSGGSTPIALYGRAAEVYAAPFKPHCRVGFMRIYSVYGFGQHDNFIKKALNSAITGEKLVVFNPHHIRDWIHVEDVADAIVHQVENYMRSGKISLVTHIGTGAGLPVSSALETIRAVTRCKISVEYGNAPAKNEPIVSVAQKIPQGWSARIPFDRGIARLFERELSLLEDRKGDGGEGHQERADKETSSVQPS